MKIEIRGAGVVNKGAELMLLSVIQELRERLNADIKFVVEPHENMPYEKRVALGLYAIPRFRKYRILWGTPLTFLPKYVRKHLGIINENEIDVVIDISGFRYGDFWGARNAIGGLTGYLKKWKRKGIKVILLPQAFGPFKGKKISKHMSKVFEYADFIAARDSTSFDHLQKLEPEGEKHNLHLYPDFTPSIAVQPEKEYQQDDCIYIIPNTKMLVDPNYRGYLNKLVIYLDDTNRNFSFLIHEGIEDYNLAKAVVNDTQRNVPIVWEKNPIRIKKIIKSAHYIITSRYHGLINGLSQGIPSLSTSWSHKYETLMREYDFKNGVINDLSDLKDTIEKISLLEENYNNIRSKIERNAELHKKKVDEMWQKVVDIIEH